MNSALLRDGAASPSGFWLRYSVHRGFERLRIFAVVLLLPVGLLAGLYWKADLGDKAGGGEVAAAVAETVAAAALLHLALGALLDLVCETGRFGALLRREVLFYFHTPVPYIVMVLFTVTMGGFFYSAVEATHAVSYRFAFQGFSFFFIILLPILTIRSFAEEKASGTVEPLLTAPVSEAQVVAGKFFGALVFFLVMLLPTVGYYAILRFVGAGIGKPDGGPVLAGYCGVALFGAFIISIGIFASTLTQDAVLGAFLGFVMTFLFWVAEFLMGSRQVLDTPAWKQASEYISPINHLDPFLKGTIAPLDVLYFATFILFFLFLAARAIEYRKWR